MQHRVLFLVLLLGACGGGDDGPPDANPFCLEAVNHSDLEWIQDNIFTPSCSRFSACHQRDNQGRLPREAAFLTLEEGESEEQMVNVPSELFDEFMRVVPGDPENSYLMIILGHFPGPLTEEGTMPYNSPLLCVEQRDAIARWITSLAPPPDAGMPDAGITDAAPPDAAP
jgi:hypothetical protein